MKHRNALSGSLNFFLSQLKMFIKAFRMKSFTIYILILHDSSREVLMKEAHV